MVMAITMMCLASNNAAALSPGLMYVVHGCYLSTMMNSLAWLPGYEASSSAWLVCLCMHVMDA
jgi:hypothetical protein